MQSCCPRVHAGVTVCGLPDAAIEGRSLPVLRSSHPSGAHTVLGHPFCTWDVRILSVVWPEVLMSACTPAVRLLPAMSAACSSAALEWLDRGLEMLATDQGTDAQSSLAAEAGSGADIASADVQIEVDAAELRVRQEFVEIFWCGTCRLQLTDSFQFEDHLVGRKHKKNVRRFGDLGVWDWRDHPLGAIPPEWELARSVDP